MKQWRINDNSRNEKADFKDIENLTNKLADKTLEKLEQNGVFVFPENLKAAEDITNKQMLLRSEDDSYWASNVMGFVGCEDERLVITSRFFDDKNDFFLQYLLEKVLDFPNIVDLEIDTNQDNKIFQWLLFLFPYYLQAAVRKGLFRMYIRNEYNDANVKGKIDIARHIRKNTPFVGKIAYTQREYTHDNYLMELIRHTIEFIKRKPYGRKILVRAKLEVEAVKECTPHYNQGDRNKIVAKNNKNVVRHAYYREYRALQRLCLLILKEQKHQVGDGARKIYGVLFDGAWLWEEYVATIIGEKFYHPMNKGNSGAQSLFTTADRKIGLIYPDFISKNTDQRIIADAKYKPKNNIGNKDYLQVLAYMFRFDAKTGYYIYPEGEANNKNAEELFMNQGSTYEKPVKSRDDIRVIKYGMKIPKKADTYDTFQEEIAAEENLLRAEFGIPEKKFKKSSD